ncbi:hypothetical protein F8M41_026087 [Gigaspora margarita]|uniref:Uncharacterized protein n=1 Tax=Gigaspora margarita TaxID=4874 RepID=A0A8H3XIZ5_GIGMA|nr:hypothetical protein F8M41_026087 [Gigaspora margarita]
MIPKFLKLAQSKPIFKVYQEKNKVDSHHHYKITSDVNLYKISNTEDINDKKLWPNSTTKSLLVYLSDYIKDYQFRKNQFYVKAALYLRNEKTGSQVASKIKWLINKYMKESANKTGKDVSKW